MLTLLLIMKIEAIANVLFLISAGYFGYRFAQYVCRWWQLPIEAGSGWTEFWRPFRKQMMVMAAVLVISVSLPSRTEAAAIFFGDKVANSSIWDRLLNSRELDAAIKQLQK